jgi:chloramphenicol O-acetyltransferase type A
MKKIDQTTWKRRDHFEFFRNYEQPFFNLCTSVEVTETHAFSRSGKLSFFLCSLFAALKAANEVEEFRTRIRGDEVIIHEAVHGGSTVFNDNQTFSFCYFLFKPDFPGFYRAAAATLNHRDQSVHLHERDDLADALIHFSVVPWVRFTGLVHPRKSGQGDSIPKIVFGKVSDEHNRRVMPISIDTHHSLVDGYHIGLFLARMQEILSAPGIHLAGHLD